MRNMKRIDVVDIILKSYDADYPNKKIQSILEAKFVANLTPEQRLQYTNITLENDYMSHERKKNLIKYVLAFVSTINGVPQIPDIIFD